MNQAAEKEQKQRTLQQNKCLHQWCEEMAESLNDAGLEKKVVLEHLMKIGMMVPWTKTTVKEEIWKVVQAAMFLKGSTTQLNTVEPDKILRVIQRHFAEEHGLISPPWPNWKDEQ